MGIKHSTLTGQPDNPDYDVSSTEWNQDHDIDGDVDFKNHQSLRHRVENVTSLPTPDNTMIGRIVIDQSTGIPYICVPA